MKCALLIDSLAWIICGMGVYLHEWCPILGGEGGGSKMTPKNRLIEGKNRIKGEGGKKCLKKLDIIYVWSLRKNKQTHFHEKNS